MTSIAGLDKVALLRALWRFHSPPHVDGADDGAFDAGAAAVAVHAPVATFCGRALDVDISGAVADGALYDAVRCCGAFDGVVAYVGVRPAAAHEPRGRGRT